MSHQKSQQNQITQNEIMQMLHKKKMAIIEKCFQEKEKGLSIQQFLKVMLEHLDYNQKDKDQHLKITIALVELFKEIDVNGDGTMQWQQFSNHIIELGLLRNDRSFKNMIKSYYPSDTIIDKQKHQNSIENIYYFQKLKYLFSIEKDSSRFKVYNVNNSNLIYEVNAHKGSILAVQYLNNQNLIATSSNDLTINFWDASSFTLKQIVSVPEIQLSVRYANWKSSNTQLLYTGGSDAIIHIYDANTLKQKGTMNGWNPFYKSDNQQYGHSGPIGDILPIDSQQTLVTAGYDGNICLWDSITHLPKKQLRGHDKGVYSLDWCDWSQMNQCLLSAGLDHEAFVWNTYVKQKIFLLRGHNHPLVGIKCLPQTPQIITADIAGMVKIWDVRNFLCMQTYNVPTDEVNSFCLTYSSGNSQNMKKRIICASKKMYYFEYDEPKDQYLTDQKICLKVIFNQTLLCFITLHSDCLKVWDAKQGKLQSVYRELSNGQLTVAILDSRQRKLFVGDSEGTIFTVNIKNGARMKTFQSHPQLITGLAYWTIQSGQLQDEHLKDQRRLVSCSRGTQVYIHDEDAPQDAQTTCRYVMKQHKQGCNGVVIKYSTQLLASASDDGNVIITNLVSYRQQIIPRASECQIKKLVFLGQHNCLVSSDANGKITFYAIGETKFRNKILFQTHYKTLSLTKKEQIFPVTAINFDKYNNILLLGDQFGNIQGWDLTQFLKLLESTKIEQKKQIKKKKSIFQTKQDLDITQSNFITSIGQRQINQVDISDFHPKLIKISNSIKKAHNDGITHIQIIQNYHSFATSSFDCCCYVWSLKNYKKIGSLIIGGDKNWGLKFNLEEKKKHNLQEAKKLLKKIEKNENQNQSDDQQPGAIQRKKLEFKSRKQKSIINAKNLIEKQRKFGLGNERKQNKFIDAVQEAQRMEKQIFSSSQNESEDQTKNYHLLSDVVDFKKKLGTSITKKQSKGSKI